MSSVKLNKLGFMVAGAALLALAVTQGCSSDDDSQAMPSAGSPGTGGKSGNGEGGSGDTTGEAGTGNVGNSSSGGAAGAAGGGNEAGTGGEAGTAGAGPTCTGTDGCYSCAPTNSIQFENGCVTGGCPDTFTDKLTKAALVGTL